jgi:hypothetical protein
MYFFGARSSICTLKDVAEEKIQLLAAHSILVSDIKGRGGTKRIKPLGICIFRTTTALSINILCRRNTGQSGIDD